MYSNILTDAQHWGTARLRWHLFVKNLLQGETDIALIQEPWFYGDQIRGLRNKRGTPFSAGPRTVPRFGIFIRSTVHAFLLSELCSRDVVTVKMTYTRERKWEHNLTSAYLPYDSHEPNKWLREVTHNCCRNKLHLIFGCDTSEHHIIWGSTDINPRGECPVE